MIHRILSLLEEHNMTAKELTEKLQIGKSSITEWKNGKTKPSINSLIGISQIFDVSLDWLLTGDGERPKNKEVASIEKKLSIDEETLLDSYREMNSEGKKKLQKDAKYIWAEHRKPRGDLSNSLSVKNSVDELSTTLDSHTG